jgi:hypothetical protein
MCLRSSFRWSVLLSVTLLGAAAQAAPRTRDAKPGRPAPKPAAAAPIPPDRQLRKLEILPARISLSGAGARQLLVVTGTYADGSVRDVSDRVAYSSTRPDIAAVSTDGKVSPAKDGSAFVRAALGSISAQVLAQVTDSKAGGELSFTRDIVPILTQAGCNALSCHGSPVGKAGFKLSMYGFDPALDHDAIVKQKRGTGDRALRIDAANPEQSLVVQKPTMQVPHQGGMRFKAGSPEHALLLKWLKAGAPMDAEDPAPVVSQLELLPTEQVLSGLGERQRLAVMAHWSDGRVEDVTERSVFSTNDDAVAKVDTRGRVEVGATGETAILARFLGRVGVSRIVVPQKDRVAPKEYERFIAEGFIDRLALAKWQKLRIVPADLSTDTEFLRRVSLDLIGTLPTSAEVRSFTADRGADKRARKIDELLGRPEFADWWALFWGDMLRNNSRLILPQGAKIYRDWIHQSVAADKPYDQFVRELVTASGQTFESGPANFFRVARTPPDQAEQVAQLFLGVRLQCANCHNHPFEKWTRTSYHQFAALFARVQVRNLPANQGSEINRLETGEYKHPENNQVLAPAVLADSPVEMPSDSDRRTVLADWLTARDNRLFARNLVNRLWGQLFGRGIVEPVDDIRVTNPAVNEPLLEALADELVRQNFSVKSMLRLLANSRTYQLSARSSRRNAGDTRNFSRAYYRRLKAEALLDAISQATDIAENFAQHPAGTRAIQLTDNRVASYFLDTFGRPRREVVCSCEREEVANITQALHMMNGSTVQSKISSARSRAATMDAAGKSTREIVEELYLWTLSRLPDSDELERALKLFEEGGTRKGPLEDLFWVLLNSREFLYNH